MNAICKIGITALASFLLNQSTLAVNDLVKLRLTCHNGYYDETVVRFMPGATDYHDPCCDAWKMFSPSPDVPHIYTKEASSFSLAINSFDYLAGDTVVDVFSEIRVAGAYELSITQLELNPGVKAYLQDMITGSVYEISESTVLNLTLSLGVDVQLYKLWISNPVSSATQSVSCFGMADGHVELVDEGNHDFDVAVFDQSWNMIHSAYSVDEQVVVAGLMAGSYTIVTTSNTEMVDTLSVIVTEPAPLVADFSSADTVYTSQAGFIAFTNESVGATTYEWNFGTGANSSLENPTYNYSAVGSYQVTLTAVSGVCSSIYSKHVVLVDDVATGIVEFNESTINITQINDQLQISSSTEFNEDVTLIINDLSGKIVHVSKLPGFINAHRIEADFSTGIYFVQVVTNTNRIAKKIFIN